MRGFLKGRLALPWPAVRRRLEWARRVATPAAGGESGEAARTGCVPRLQTAHGRRKRCSERAAFGDDARCL